MIEMDKKGLAVMMEAGYVYIGMKRFKDARELFLGLTALVPDSDVPHVALGNVDFCDGKLPHAIKHYKHALKLDPNSLFAQVYLGEALFFAGEKDEAMELLNGVMKSDRGGGAGEFAKALVDAIKGGFDPTAKKTQ